MAMREYLVGEVTEEHSEGLLPRREAGRRRPRPARSARRPPPSGKGVGKLITYSAGGQNFRGAYKAAPRPKGAVLVIPENKGLITHFVRAGRTDGGQRLQRAVRGCFRGTVRTALPDSMISPPRPPRWAQQPAHATGVGYWGS